MTKLALLLLAALTPPVDREAAVGDTVERFSDLRASAGAAAARRWLWREVARAVKDAPRHRLAARAGQIPNRHGRKAPIMSALWQDLRYALRWFGRSPGFTVVAVATLAIGIGANTAMFAVVNAVLLKPLPFADADRLMLVHLSMPGRLPGQEGVYQEIVWSYPKYQSFLEVQRGFEETALFAGRTYSLSGDGEAEQVRGEIITDRYLSVLGIEPILGRPFTADEAHRPRAAPVVILGHGLWIRRYGGDASVLGRLVEIGRVPHAIVGVLPRGFRGLNGNAELWTPMAVSEFENMQGRQSHSYQLVARRAAHVSEAAIPAGLRLAGAHVDRENTEGPGEAPWGATARSLHDSRLDTDLRRMSFVVLGAVGFVLLIACVNLTNLLAAKAMARRREGAIRVALGAGRARIARQFGVESLLLAGAGSVVGLAFAVGLLASAEALLPDSNVFFQASFAPGSQRISGAAGLTRISAGSIGLDQVTLAFTAGLMLFTTVAVSILPALQAWKSRPAHAMASDGRAASSRGAQGFGSRAALVSVEIALALVLLAGAGLMLKSAMGLYRTNIGADPSHVLTAELELPGARYPPERGAVFQDALLTRVRALPGVESAGWSYCIPVSGRCNGTLIWFPPRPQAGPGRDPLVGITWITSGYLETLRIPIVAGRMFTDRDRAGQPKVALVNETAARTFWPGQSAVGRRIAVGQGGFHDGAEVVGVVADVRYRTLEGTTGAAVGPDVYLPLAQSYRSRMHLVVRSQLDTRSLVSAIGRDVRALDPALALVGITIKTMNERIDDAMWRTRVGAWLLSAFAGLAMFLSAIGVFSVMAQTVTQRTREFGLRVALGAQRRDVLGLVLRRAAIVTACGVAIGLVAALGLTRVLTALLNDVTPGDPVTLVVVAVVLGVVSLAAAYIPARRAVRIDPTRALRSE